MSSMLLLLVTAATICAQLTAISAQQCNGTRTFIKVSDRVPPDSNLVLLVNSPGNAVTADCAQRCLSSNNCQAFLVNYDRSACFRVTSTNVMQYSGPPRPVDVVTATNYFEAACLQVPSNCSSKLWVLEQVYGYELVGPSRAIFSNISSGQKCGQLCLSERHFACRSARYNSNDRQCILSVNDRRTLPDSYRAAKESIQYWENQCAPNVFTGQMCSLEEFPDSTMCCADRSFRRITQEQCISRCNNETSFNCRGLTYIPPGSNNVPAQCLLHGEDTSSVGPRAVQHVTGSTYWERVPCLDLLVMCSPAMMMVTLHSDRLFDGRMYVQGKSDQCTVRGRNSRDVSLKIPIQDNRGRQINRCGVMIVRSEAAVNRTLISTVVVVQYNAIIQRRGDRAVKVRCILDDSAPTNVTLGASLSFGSSDSFINGGTVVLNSSAVPPTVSLQILDRSAGSKNTNVTQLGQDLELRINVNPENSSYDIRPAHLIAASEDNSQTYLLLDDRGCPADSQTFPAMRRVSPNSTSLVANFRAFKFPNSNVVKFNVTVHFCAGTCPPIDCGQGVTTIGRRRREAFPTDHMFQELPLQLAIVVETPMIVSSAIHAVNGSQIITAGVWPGGVDPDEVCMQWGTLLGVALAWVLLQFVILVACYVATHWRKRPSPQDEHKLEDDFPGYSNHRHVHWADDSIDG